MDWKDKLQIIGALIISLGWFEYNHREDNAAIELRHREDLRALKEDMKASDERWRWLFDWAHYEVNELKSRHNTTGKS